MLQVVTFSQRILFANITGAKNHELSYDTPIHDYIVSGCYDKWERLDITGMPQQVPKSLMPQNVALMSKQLHAAKDLGVLSNCVATYPILQSESFINSNFLSVL